MFSVLSKTDIALLALGCFMILAPIYALTPLALTNASAFATSHVAAADAVRTRPHFPVRGRAPG